MGQQGMQTLPMDAHYRGHERLGQWTSGKMGLLPWLLRQIAADRREGTTPAKDGGTLPGKDGAAWPDLGSLLEFSVIRSIAGMFCLGPAAEKGRLSTRPHMFGTEPVCSVSHLSDLHDLILLEDCLFSRTLSMTLTVA